MGKKAMNKLKYNIVISKLESVFTLSEALANQDQKNLFKVRYADLEDLYTEFQDLHLQLASDIDKDDDPAEKYMERFKTITDNYYNMKAIYLKLFSPSEKQNTGPESENSISGLKLPHVNIPTFSGKVEEFAHFIDLFEALVGNDSKLSDAQKMYYLFGSLSGEAKTLVQHLSVTGENYTVLLDILKSRYANKRLHADKLLSTMLSLSHVNRNLHSIKTFLNTLLETTKGLEKAGFPVKMWSYLLLHINLNKLDTSLKRQFEEKYGGDQELPTFDNFISFLTREVQILETTDTQKSSSSSHKVHISYNKDTKQKCVGCRNGSHYLNQCPDFIKLKTYDRKRLVLKHQLCFRCLNNHNINDCKTRLTCNKCSSEKHHSLLHFDATVKNPAHSTGADRPNAEERPVGQGTSAQGSVGNPSTANVLHAVSAHNCRRAVLLSTAVVRVLGKNGTYQEARALIDGGSQSTIVTEECATRLGLRPKRSGSIAVRGIGGNSLKNSCKGTVVLRISPLHVDNPILTTTGLVLGKIADDLPSGSLPINLSDYYADLHLADKRFYESRKIDMLIGADIMSEILLDGVVHVPGLPCAINTIFGYILQGPVSYSCDSSENYHTLFVNTNTDTLLEKFFEIEDVPPVKVTNPKDDECEDIFRKTHSRDNSGRYVVRLPFLSEKPELGDSVSLAKKRFLAMERRLLANSGLRDKYVNFMRDYGDMGHMSVCDGTPDDYVNGNGYVIPHHGIFKAESDKIRVVFDASCVTTSGVSLNDALHAGPKLQRDVMEIICRFRLSEFVFTTDIKMMFRQIVVHPDDRHYQMIFWREAPDEPLLLHKLNTVTYGMKSSPYLAIRTLRQLADDNTAQYPAAANLLRSSVFMDDILGGANTEAEAKQLKSDLTDLLRSGGFELSKWVSNSSRLLEDIPVEDLEKPRTFDKTEGPGFFKILGVEWDPNRDCFSYHTKLKKESGCTKRIILSTVARTFDPLGWIAPVILQGKVLMQRLWRLNLEWDQTPPPDVVTEWDAIVKDLPQIENVAMKRFVLSGSTSCALHGFSDASEIGYSAAVYLRTVNKNGDVEVPLMMAKSRVAPAKIKLTIPKLELLGATLLTRLIKYVVEAIKEKVEIDDVVCWSDSTIVLSWLRIPPHNLQVFEGNRVSQILNCGLNLTWRHLPSELNPADVASRGCRATDLVGHPLWWGPQWLRSPSELWPPNIVDRPQSDLPGMRKLVVKVHVGTVEPDPIFTLYSSLVQLQSVVAYCLRFAHNTKNPLDKRSGVLSVRERHAAMDRLIKLVQATEFASDIECLNRNKQCSTRLRRLLPFVDEDGLLRVGGRLNNSNLPFHVKHPLLLPKIHPLTNLIVDNAHKVHCHVGPTALQAILQKDFWILSARQVIRSRIFRCIFCFRTRAKPTEPIMSALPSDRVNVAGVFHTVQTDFAGPFSVKASRLRNAKITKAYLCVFICSSTKAVHLEVVGDLSTEAFLAALFRFTSRRGLPSVIRSDNGTNYVGTNRHLDEVQKYLARRDVQESLGNDASKTGITWIFNAPAAPHFGGLFEAAVKSAKTLLKRIIGEQVLTFEELVTVFTRIEAVLNSRPLCPLSNDPQDCEVLTPAHFLVGKPLLSVPEFNFHDVPDNRLSRYRLVQALSQRFWHKWSDQYLHTLQNRNKWNSPTEPPNIGDLVLIKEENIPPLKWKLGRIIELSPGKDGVIRVVSLKTSSGTLVRPVVKICRLPLY